MTNNTVLSIKEPDMGIGKLVCPNNTLLLIFAEQKIVGDDVTDYAVHDCLFNLEQGESDR